MGIGRRRGRVGVHSSSAVVRVVRREKRILATYEWGKGEVGGFWYGVCDCDYVWGCEGGVFFTSV